MIRGMIDLAMATAASRGSRHDAEDIALTLARQFPEVEAVCLFGSVARGDATTGSDLDLLVVLVGEEPSLRQLRSAVPIESRDSAGGCQELTYRLWP